MELNELIKSLDELKASVGSKAEVEKLQKQIDALSAKQNDSSALEPHSKFGTMKNAALWANYMKVAAKNLQGFEKTTDWTNVDSGVSGEGSAAVPTILTDSLDVLFSKGGLARQIHDTMQIPGGSASILVGDEVTITSTGDNVTSNKVKQSITGKTLTPVNYKAIYPVSEKFMLQSPLQAAQFVVPALVNGMAIAEDGVAAAAYKAVTGATVDTVASLSALTYEDLMNMIALVDDYSQDDGAFYMHRKVYNKVRQLEDEVNRPLIDITGGKPTLFGAPVVIWNRLEDASAAGEVVALYGNLRRAGMNGLTGATEIKVSTEAGFTDGTIIWRLQENYGFVVKQPGAVAVLKVAAS